MSYSTFNQNKFNFLTQPMFLGETPNVSRYDQQKHAKFEKLIEKQLAFFWRPEEVNVTRDRIDYMNLPDHEKHIFISNLKYQILLDSVQGRGPNAVLLPIVSDTTLETWVETWAFSECLAEGTEVLTGDGWKDLGDVTVKDPCLVYDLDTEKVFFENPKRVAEYDVDTDMVRFKSTNKKQFDQLVTPNHRMPIVHRDVRADGTQKRYFKDAIVQEYLPHHLAPVSGNTVLRGEGMSPIERLRVAIQADGSVSDRYTGVRCGTVPVWFELKKERKINRLIQLCKEAGVALTELTPSKNRRFKVDIPVGDAVEDMKLFSWIDLTSVNFEWATDFMEELAEWDSHIHNDNSFTYTTAVKYNADVVQALCCLCGKSPRMAIRTDERKETYSDIYEINVISRMHKDGQSIEKTYEKYKGKVRCLETSTGAFVIRYNGVVSVTGNTIHSRSYTHIIRNILADPSIVFDDIMQSPEIIARAEAVTKMYDDLYLLNCRKALNLPVDPYTHARALYLCLHNINALEAIRFYVSFACSFAFGERGVMLGNTNIIELIARDEALHLSGTQYMLKEMQNGNEGDLFARVAEDCYEEARQGFIDASVQEKDWGSFLFKDGSMIGLNKGMLDGYIDYITDQRMRAVGLGELIGKPTKNPIPWINSHLSTSNVQVTPQETENGQYLSGQVDSSMSASDFNMDL